MLQEYSPDLHSISKKSKNHHGDGGITLTSIHRSDNTAPQSYNNYSMSNDNTQHAPPPQTQVSNTSRYVHCLHLLHYLLKIVTHSDFFFWTSWNLKKNIRNTGTFSSLSLILNLCYVTNLNLTNLFLPEQIKFRVGMYSSG